MANKKSGLGRGLNSLIGESMGEIGAAPEKKEAEAPKEKAPVPQSQPRPAKPVPAPPAPAVVEEEPEEPAAPKPVAHEKKPATPRTGKAKPHIASAPIDEAVRSDVLKVGEPKPAPYIEEDDHVTIKGVVEREKQQEDEVPITVVKPNPDQPRTHFKPEEIEELASSIEKEGLLQPVLVRKVGDTYQIIAGERRWQACKSLGMKKIPIRVKEATDDKALELALIENIQRSDLNPIEEAYGYKRLMERKGMTQSDVAQAVSKGRSTIANALRLLELPEDAQQLLFEEKITAGHARAILLVPSREGRQKLTEKLSKEKLSVRETENLARLFAGRGKAEQVSTKREPMPQYFKKAARGLREQLQTNVRVKTVKGKNKIEIEFKDEDDLKRLFDQIVTADEE